MTIEQLVQQIHQGSAKYVLAVSGGGSGALAALLTTPGASRTVLEATIPYSEGAMISWLGGRPDQFCSARTARAMAMVAFHRAKGYVTEPAQLAGVACTASLATDRPKLGPHRAHFALQTDMLTAFWSIDLQKGQRTRREEEALVDALLLDAIAEGSGVSDRLEPELRSGEVVQSHRTEAAPAWRDLLLGSAQVVREGQGAPPQAKNGVRVIFPGEFNPLHLGHRRMAQIAEEQLGLPAEFEISVINVDKPPLDYFEIRRRTGQFKPEQVVWLTRAARFTEKSRLFPGAIFVVGIDTLRRIAAPRYYGNDPAACLAAIQTIAQRGCRFLVFGRNLGTGFVCLRDLDLPPELLALCTEVPADRFREDVSSTLLRRAGRW